MLQINSSYYLFQRVPRSPVIIHDYQPRPEVTGIEPSAPRIVPPDTSINAPPPLYDDLVPANPAVPDSQEGGDAVPEQGGDAVPEQGGDAVPEQGGDAVPEQGGDAVPEQAPPGYEEVIEHPTQFGQTPTYMYV